MAVVTINAKDVTYYLVRDLLIVEYKGIYYNLEISRSYWSKRFHNLRNLILIDINSVDTFEKLKNWLTIKDEYGDIIEYCIFLRYYNKNYISDLW